MAAGRPRHRRPVCRQAGTYNDFLTKLAQASGIETPTLADLAKLDRKRKNKGSNQDWEHPHDPDARIAKMKDGRTHLAHKAEHAVDLETGLPAAWQASAIVAVTLQEADQGDTTTIQTTLPEAIEQLEAFAAVTDDRVRTGGRTGHRQGLSQQANRARYAEPGTAHLHLSADRQVSEPDRGRQHWIDQHAERDAVYTNRRRIQSERGQQLMRLRCELLERPNAHLYETGGMRRTHLSADRQICGGTAIFSNGCSCTWRPATWACGCAR